MAASAGYKARFAAMPTTGTFDGSTPRWDINTINLGVEEDMLVSPGITGTRTMYSQQRQVGNYLVRRGFVINPSYAFLAEWLPRILGTAASGTTYAVADTVPAWDVILDHVGRIDKFVGCKVNTATLEIPAKGLSTLSFDCYGLTATETGISWAAAAFGTTTAYAKIAAQSCGFTFAAGSIAVRKITLKIDNHLEAIPAIGSTAAESILETGRTVSLAITVPSTSANLTALYAIEGAVTVTAAATGLSLSVAMSKVLAPRVTPPISGKGEVTFEWNAQAMADLSDGATFDCKVTLDSTP